MAIEERYASETQQAILDRMKNDISDEFDKRESSHVHDMLSPASIELAKAYIALDQVLTYGFANENTPREYLELRAAELGVEPNPATKAAGEVTFSGDDAENIPSGTRVSTDDDDPIYAVTTADASIPAGGGSVTVAAEAEEAGAEGNVAAGELTLVRGDLSDVLSVTNDEAFEGGADEESDESLLERYYNRARNPGTSGNAADYRSWAREISGVTDAKVFPVWNGAGTVKVVLLGEGGTAPDSAIVDEVSTHIEEERPIGADVTTVAATEVAIDVTADVQLASGATISGVTADYEEALTEYLEGLAFEDPIVRYTQIASLLLDVPDIIDYDNLTMNGGTSNIEMADEEVAIIGTVTFNDVT
ncbi:baseplate J/gp47 family protein [Salibacterium lacus]|uniref:Baseplate J/gp47 family protein n=1 Tax=Salibacterium lacus TaxID=1898109 RepID=A0ABW5SZ95_9BACI